MVAMVTDLLTCMLMTLVAGGVVVKDTGAGDLGVGGRSDGACKISWLPAVPVNCPVISMNVKALFSITGTRTETNFKTTLRHWSYISKCLGLVRLRHWSEWCHLERNWGTRRLLVYISKPAFEKFTNL